MLYDICYYIIIACELVGVSENNKHKLPCGYVLPYIRPI